MGPGRTWGKSRRSRRGNEIASAGAGGEDEVSLLKLNEAALPFSRSGEGPARGLDPTAFTHLKSPRGHLPQLAGEGGAKRRMGYGPLLRRKSHCTTVIANLRRAIPAFHTPSGPPGHLPRFAEKGGPAGRLQPRRLV